MTRYFSEIQIAVFGVNTNPIKTKVNCNFNHSCGSKRDPQTESWITVAQFLLQSMGWGLGLVHRILLKTGVWCSRPILQ
jgi:hypothetical protein